jgi:hypothetical protein
MAARGISKVSISIQVAKRATLASTPLTSTKGRLSNLYRCNSSPILKNHAMFSSTQHWSTCDLVGSSRVVWNIPAVRRVPHILGVWQVRYPILYSTGFDIGLVKSYEA